jgi:hypothetical protein
MPSDIAHALGIELANSVRFKDLLLQLTNQNLTLPNLTKYMPRKTAENAFKHALRKECFQHSSLFSFYFNEGWLEFALHFDETSKLRRLYIRHKLLLHPTELVLQSKNEQALRIDDASSSDMRCIA